MMHRAILSFLGAFLTIPFVAFVAAMFSEYGEQRSNHRTYTEEDAEEWIAEYEGPIPEASNPGGG